MKINKRMFLILSLIIGEALYAHTQELFLTANQLYKEEDYQKAYETYKAIALKSSAIWYNMGNCAFHMQDYARALVYWLLAVPQSSAQQINAIQYNIEQLRTHGITYQFPFVMNMIKYGSLLLFQLILLISWLVLIIGWWYRRYKMMILISSIMGVALMGIYAHVESRKEQAVVKEKKGIVLYSGPDSAFAQVATVPYATVAPIENRTSSWICLRTAQGTGWTQKDQLYLLTFSNGAVDVS
jgi:tetratricopeptide (TPR) repeat protein